MRMAIWDEISDEITTHEIELTALTPAEKMLEANIKHEKSIMDAGPAPPGWRFWDCWTDEEIAGIFGGWIVTERDGHIIGKGSFTERNHQSRVVLGPDAERILTEIVTVAAEAEVD